MWQGKTEIQRLQMRGCAGPPLTARLRAAGQLALLELRPPGLSPSAILLVRRIVDPLPHALSLSATYKPNRAWQHAVQRSVHDLYRQSARPVMGAVAATAPAVLFADEAELLACFARDWLAGSLDAHWWWRALFQRFNGTPAQILVACLQEQMRLLPAVFALLDEWDMAVQTTTRLSSGATSALLTQLLAAHQVPEFRGVTGADHPAQRAAQGSGWTAQSVPRPAPRVDAVLTDDPVPPWQPWLPHAREQTTLTPERQALLGLALALHRRPAAVRSRAFALAATRWWQHTVAVTNAAELAAAGKGSQESEEPAPQTAPTEHTAIPWSVKPAEPTHERRSGPAATMGVAEAPALGHQAAPTAEPAPRNPSQRSATTESASAVAAT
ncbi:MAG: hypothetical protein KDE53_18580, partial [Caldilineaceae bacterium]|nr:hypothetical protein [Caldilineaceae bacterium]